MMPAPWLNNRIIMKSLDTGLGIKNLYRFFNKNLDVFV